MLSFSFFLSLSQVRELINTMGFFDINIKELAKRNPTPFINDVLQTSGEEQKAKVKGAIGYMPVVNRVKVYE